MISDAILLKVFKGGIQVHFLNNWTFKRHGSKFPAPNMIWVKSERGRGIIKKVPFFVSTDNCASVFIIKNPNIYINVIV